jgi:hypothetical protein
MTEQKKLSDLLLAELAYVLRPVVSALIKVGVTSQEVDHVVRQVFVQMAIEQSDPVTMTDSRISVATGLARREVKRLRELVTQEQHSAPESVSLGSRIVSAWLTRDGYQDEQGAPRPLPRKSGDASQASFDTLVSDVSRDVRPRAILDELTRLGIVSVNASDLVSLNKEAFVPMSKGAEEKAFYLGNNLHDHAAAAINNLLETDPRPWFERSVHYKQMAAAEIEEIRNLVDRIGGSALKEVNQYVQDLPEPGPNDQKNQRFTFGIYYYSTEVEAVETQAKDKP